MSKDKKVTVRLDREIWSRADMNAKARGYRNLSEFLRICAIRLNDEALEIKKSRTLLEATSG